MSMETLEAAKKELEALEVQKEVLESEKGVLDAKIAAQAIEVRSIEKDVKRASQLLRFDEVKSHIVNLREEQHAGGHQVVVGMLSQAEASLDKARMLCEEALK